MVVAMISILAAAVLPMVPGVNDQARIGACESRVQQLGVAIRLYSEDHNAPPETLRVLLDERYIDSESLLTCTKTGKEFSYSPAAARTGGKSPILSCVSPTTPRGSRPHRHGAYNAILLASGELAAAR